MQNGHQTLYSFILYIQLGVLIYWALIIISSCCARYILSVIISSDNFGDISEKGLNSLFVEYSDRSSELYTVWSISIIDSGWLNVWSHYEQYLPWSELLLAGQVNYFLMLKVTSSRLQVSTNQILLLLTCAKFFNLLRNEKSFGFNWALSHRWNFWHKFKTVLWFFLEL